ncbi:MAG TPA: hypothetical protein VGN84_05940 [Solirubrobacterales bacterium]|nr:hypothetical protein [Solirubrobacterales bacterium]
MATPMGKKPSRYAQIIERVFFDNYTPRARTIRFSRAEFAAIAKDLGIKLPSNLGDVLYSYRYRNELPAKVLAKQPRGLEWAIFPANRKPTEYRFTAVPSATITPTLDRPLIEIPDATPGLIGMYAIKDEQALLAKLRYNRLLDVYTGVTTYSLQSHLRTAIPESQVEVDEVYVGIDKLGRHHMFPVQAKGGKDFLSVVQVWQDFKMCAAKFPKLIAHPIAAQFMGDDVIALFSFKWDGADGITVARGSERHYKLVPSAELT